MFSLKQKGQKLEQVEQVQVAARGVVYIIYHEGCQFIMQSYSLCKSRKGGGGERA